MFFNLTYLDDNVFFVEKTAFLSHWASIPRIFSGNSFLESGGVFYRPVLILSMMADAALGKGSLAFSHAFNIALHAAASCLVYGFFRRLGHGASALPLALVFCAHPVSAQAVAWLPGRTDTLLALFVLAAFNAFADFSRDRRLRDALLHLLFFALALLTKELAVVVPAACLLYLWAQGLSFKSLPKLIAAWLVLLFAWHLARKSAMGGAEAYTAASALRSLVSNLPAALSYLGKMSWPGGYCSYPILQDMKLWPGMIAFAATAAALALSSLENPRRAAWGLAWAAMFLLPSFVYPAAHIEPVFFEYRAYLPLAGLLSAWGEVGWLKAYLARPGRRVALWATISALAAAALLNSGRYRDGLAYWSQAARCSPRSAFSHKQLGVMHYFRKAFPEAEREYRAALALNAAEPLAHNNLGVLYMAAGRLDLAEREFSTELALNPDYDNALYNLGLVYFRQGLPARARALWERTLRAHPGYADAARSLEELRRRGL